ncbi:MAG: hypothetical protein M3336_13070, partial [Chloroflexota bacterium]|nr:hypothetical protein [Chloroflexota bacterium]
MSEQLSCEPRLAIALARASSLVGEALPEERLLALLARAAMDAAVADAGAVYLAPEAGAGGLRAWRLAGTAGDADPQPLASLPTAYGAGSAVLAPLFQAGREVRESDLLDG